MDGGAAPDAGTVDASTAGDAGADGGPAVDGGTPACDIGMPTAMGPWINGGLPNSRASTVWTGVGWLHFEIPQPSTTSPWRVTAAPIARDGARGTGHTLASFARADQPPQQLRAVWTGTHALLFWLRYTSGANRLWVARTDGLGAPTDPPVQLGVAPNPFLDAVWTGSQAVVAYQGRTAQVELLRLDATGAPLGAATPIDAPETGSPRLMDVAWNGRELGVAFRLDVRGGSLYFTRVSADGIAQPTALVADATTFASVEAPRLQPDGTDWILAARSDAAVRVYRLTATGAITSSFDVPLPTDAYAYERQYDLVLDAGGYVLSYVTQATTSTPRRLQLLRLDATGAAVGPAVDPGYEGLNPELLRSDRELALLWTGPTMPGVGQPRRNIASLCGAP